MRDDGSESGTRRAGVVAATGAIAFSNIEVSADANEVQKQIYVSSPDGDLVGSSGRCALFLTAQGMVLCTPGGNFKNLTRDRYWPAASQRAGAVFIREAGRSRYLASLMSS